MNREDEQLTDEERREAELLARALGESARPGRDVAAVDDALGAAWLIHASRDVGQAELRRRAALERLWPKRSWRLPGRALAAAAAVAVFFFFFMARSRAHLPAPGADFLRAQLAAARPGSDAALARFEHEHAKYRGQVFAALRRAYGRRP
jgi:anti-sigma-K factor RskA